MKKRITVFVMLLFIVFLLPVKSYAIEDIFNAQLESIEPDKIEAALDEETLEQMEDIGVELSYRFASEPINYEVLFEEILSVFQMNAKKPIQSCVQIIGIIVLAAILQGIKDCANNSGMSETAGFVISAISCALISFPIAEFINEISEIMQKGCGFISVVAPIIGALGAMAGKSFTSSNYNAFILIMVETLAFFTGKIAIPLLKIMLALSSVCAVSNTVAFDKIISAIEKNSKWMLTFIAALMVGILNISTLAASGADIAAAKALRLVVSSAIPVIGGSIGDAIGTINGSIAILRSTVGAFGIIATGFIFLPTLIKAFLWGIGLDICASVAEMFSLERISKTLKSFSSVISIMLSITVFVLAILIASTAIVLK